MLRELATNCNCSDLKVYTPEEAADRLEVTSSWLRAQARSGLLPCTRLGRRMLFSSADIAEIIRLNSRPARVYSRHLKPAN